ncbi:MAG: tRNA uridine(34) 5-carboxymethylaminomethyl modification radical SAM/GNAT enzyme Elp3 [Candidatus Hydrothermarchaeales archaeon]
MDPAIYLEIADEILAGSGVSKAKAVVCKRHRLEKFPSNADILGALEGDMRRRLLPVLLKKPVRTISGVAVVAVMTSPEPCPHGRCAYCPTGEGSPQSYTGFEPAALRGRRSDFDPFVQVSDRLSQLETIGHNVDKAELIVMGGTFPARDRGYQEWFVRRCFDAMNSFGREDKLESPDIESAHSVNEKAGVRNVGVTFETRPDYAGEEQVDWMLGLGGTRLEMGVQTLRDDVYAMMDRGHTVQHVIDATRIVKDAGLKLGYHMMPGLFSTPRQDLQIFETLFSSPDFRPDMLKIYPTLVLERTKLYGMWEKGDFIPLTDEECVDLICEIKKGLPKWVRTMRIQRDIPAGLVAAGLKKGNLGELVTRRMDEEGVRCRCIRCREAGHQNYKKGVKVSNIEILTERYNASKGSEYFISAEDLGNDVICGYLRLRFPSKHAHRIEIDGETAVVRELKVLGRALKIGEQSSGEGQHKGIGRALIEKAKEISRENGKNLLLVTSAVGTREYYRALGFKLLGPYMEKKL